MHLLIKYLLLTEFEGRTVSYGSSFFSLRFMAQVLTKKVTSLLQVSRSQLQLTQNLIDSPNLLEVDFLSTILIRPNEILYLFGLILFKVSINYSILDIGDTISNHISHSFIKTVIWR